MAFVFSSINRVFDFILAPLLRQSALVCLFVVSIFTAFILLYFFKILSNQERIRFHKNRIFGFILEIGLFRDQFSKIVKNQFYILYHNILYLNYTARPLLILMVPVIIVSIQLENRLGYQPIQAGNEFIIRAELDEAVSPDLTALLDRITIEVSGGIELLTKPVRIESEGIAMWRARYTRGDAAQYVRFGFEGQEGTLEKKVAVQQDTKGMSPLSLKAASFSYPLYSAEPPIPAGSLFKSLYIEYAHAVYPFWALYWSPVVYFFVLTLIVGLLIKPFIKVNI